MSQLALHPCAAAPVPEARPVVRSWLRRAEDVLVWVFDAIEEWHERSLTRRRLASMDDRMLADIGIDRADVTAEVDKPFWRG